jgi:putative GTP pyrophosphokinase
MMEEDRDLKTQVDALKIEEIEELREIAVPFVSLMMEFRCALMEIETKLNVLNSEFAMTHNRNPIQTIKTRLKKPASILEKLNRKGLEVSISGMEENLSDIAGVRVICSFPDDIYAVADMMLHQDDLRMLEIKDYIKNPKDNGYRSLHLIMEVPIFLSEGKKFRKVEIQFRTIAMDFWASVEHQLRYKKDLENAEEISRELKECADLITSVDYRMQELREKIEYTDEQDQWEREDKR